MLRAERLLGTKSVFYEATFVDGLVKYLLVFKPIKYLGSIRLHRTQRRTPPPSADINILLSFRPSSTDVCETFTYIRYISTDDLLVFWLLLVSKFSIVRHNTWNRKEITLLQRGGGGYAWKIRFSDATINRLLVEEQEIDEIGMDESISRHVSIVCDKTRNSDSFDGWLTPSDLVTSFRFTRLRRTMFESSCLAG